MSVAVTNLLYLLAAILFISGLKGLAHPKTAVRGNVIGSLGMLVAVVAVLLSQQIVQPWWIVAGIAAGSVVGAIFALTIKMTAMPQLVALYNGFGGIASVLVAASVLLQVIAVGTSAVGLQEQIATAASALIGAVTFWGSLVAFGKLQGIVTEKPVRYPGEQIVKVLIAAATVALAAFMVIEPSDQSSFWWLIGASSLLGVMLVIPIGGADMPIVIALLNSYSGLAAAATGFVLNNTVLIIAGSLVGASGIILTTIMCRAMNRSLTNVLFGGVGAVVQSSESADDIYAGNITRTSAEEVAMILKTAQRVAFVPGYGMAVARAQTPVRVLSEQLEAEGIRVDFGIHPVAGRMPGHMNVLLAEENISYDKLLEMDQINPELPNVDVVIVLGANDVVNPLARESSGSPISGMPILNVDLARTVVVIKRSLSPGFAGIPNPLFAADNTLMLFGDGKTAMEDLVAAYKEA